MKKCSECNDWGCALRNYQTDECTVGRYETCTTTAYTLENRNSQYKQLRKLADAMYYAAFNMTTDASQLRKAMEEYHQFVIHCKED